MLKFPRTLTRNASAAALLATLALSTAVAQNANQLGTVKTVSGNTVTITTKAGAPITVTLIPDALRILLPPPSMS